MKRKLPREVLAELAAARTGRADQLARELGAAMEAYDADRYQDAVRLLERVVKAAPTAASARELYGLALYRQGRFARAIRQLDAHHALTGSYDQYPVVADCHRALGHHDTVKQLWNELRRASPSGEVVTEGRLVAAGDLADQGDINGAIALLQRARPPTRSHRPDHLRLWYSLADLYERAGELPRARELFSRVARRDPELSDAPERLGGLG